MDDYIASKVLLRVGLTNNKHETKKQWCMLREKQKIPTYWVLKSKIIQIFIFEYTTQYQAQKPWDEYYDNVGG